MTAKQKLKFPILLALVLLSGLVHLGVGVPTNPTLATLLTAALLFGLPGYLLAELFLRPVGLTWPEKLALSFILGFMILLLPATLLLVWHANLSLLVGTSFSLTLVLIGSYIIRARQIGENPSVDFKSERLTGETLVLSLALILVIVLALYLFISIPIIAGTWGDRWNYLPYIQKYISRSTLNPSDTLIPAMDVRFARSGWLTLLALISRVSRVHPVEMYGLYLPPLLTILSIFSLFTLARVLFNRLTPALLAALIQVVYFASTMTEDLGGGTPGIGLTAFMRITDDKFFAMLVLLPTAQTFMLLYLQQGQRRYIGFYALALVSLAVTHPIGFTLAGLSLASLALVHVLTKGWPMAWPQLTYTTVGVAGRFWTALAETITGRLVLLAVVVGVTTLIPLEARSLVQDVTKAFTPEDLPPDSVFFYVLQTGQRHIIFWTPNWYMAAPTLVARPMIVLALLLTPLLLRWMRREPAARFLFSNIVIPLALIYNPWTAPWLGRVITPLQIRRVLFMLPIALVIAYILDHGTKWVQQRLASTTVTSLSPLLSALVPAALVVMLIVFMRSPIEESFNYLQDQHRHHNLSINEQDILKYIGHLGTAQRSVILAQPTLSQYIPAFAPGIWTLTFQSQITDTSVIPKVEQFYRATLVNDFVLDLLKQHRVRYVLLETQSPLTAQFNSLPSLVTLLYQNDTYSLYEVTSDLKPDQVIMANSYLSRGDLNQAIASYKQALTLTPNSFLAHFGLAQAHQLKGEIDQAIAAYEQAIALNPQPVWPYLYLAENYIARGRTVQGTTFQSKVHEMNSLTVRQSGSDRLLEIKDYQQAVTVYRRIFELNPDHPTVRKALIEGYLLLRDQYFESDLLAEVLAAYEATITQAPDNLETYLDLGQTYQRLDQPQAAVEVYRQAVAHWSGWAEAYYYLGEAYEAVGNLEAAIVSYQVAIELKSTFSLPYLRLDSIYRAKGENNSPVTLYQAAIRQNPVSAWPHLELGKFYLTQVHAR